MKDSAICSLLQESPDKGYRALFDEYHGYVYTIVFCDLKTSAAEMLKNVPLMF